MINERNPIVIGTRISEMVRDLREFDLFQPGEYGSERFRDIVYELMVIGEYLTKEALVEWDGTRGCREVSYYV